MCNILSFPQQISGNWHDTRPDYRICLKILAEFVNIDVISLFAISIHDTISSEHYPRGAVLYSQRVLASLLPSFSIRAIDLLSCLRRRKRTRRADASVKRVILCFSFRLLFVLAVKIHYSTRRKSCRLTTQ